SGGADDGGGLPGGGGEGDAVQDGGVGPGVGEGDVAELDGHTVPAPTRRGGPGGHLYRRLLSGGLLGREGAGAHGLGHRGGGVQDLDHAAGGDDRAREHHEHEGPHHHGHQDLQQVLHEGGQGAARDLPGVHALAAEPEHGGGGHVQQDGDGRAHDHEQAPDAHRVVGQRGVGAGEALGLVLLAHEGAHHPDAHDLLPHHAVDVIDV